MSFDARLYLLAISVVVLAFHVSAARRALRPVAWLLLLGLGADLSRRVARLLFLEPAAAALAGGPLTGWTRAVGHASQALFLAWGAGVFALVVWAFTERRSWTLGPVLGGGAWAGAVLGYPALRGEALANYYRGWTIAVVTLSGLCVARFFWQRRRPRQEHVASLWILLIETTLLAGPYLGGDAFSTWWTAKIAYAAMYTGLIPVLSWGALWNRPRSSPS